MIIEARYATFADLPELAALAARTFPLASPQDTDPDDIAHFIANNLMPEHFAAHLGADQTRIVVLYIAQAEDPEQTEDPEQAEDSGAQPRAGEPHDNGPLHVGDPGVGNLHVGDLVGYTLAIAGLAGTPDDSFGVTTTPSTYLSKFYVDPRAHGSHAAGTLLAALKEVARTDLGAASLWLAVNQGNARAIRFYEKHQFQRVGVKTMVVGTQTFADYVYELQL